MDFKLDPALGALRAQVRAIIDDHVIPAEAQVLEEDAQDRSERLLELRAIAKEAGLRLHREDGRLQRWWRP